MGADACDWCGLFAAPLSCELRTSLDISDISSRLKPMKVAVVRETFPGERRVALVPDSSLRSPKQVGKSLSNRAQVNPPVSPMRIIKPRAPKLSATVAVRSRRPMWCCKFAPWEPMPPRAAAISIYSARVKCSSACAIRSAIRRRSKELADRGAIAFAMELIPRITRAQSMDVLSSMATIAGYKAVLLAADNLAEDVSDADDRRGHAQGRQGAWCSAPAWRGCKRSPRRGGSAPSCRPTTCGPR